MNEQTSDFLLQIMFQYMSDAMLIVDINGVIIKVNPAVERLIGYASEELVNNMKLSDLCQGRSDSPEFTACGNCFATLESIPSFEMRLLHKSGQICSLATSVTRLPKSVGALLVVVFRDMEEYCKREQENFQRKLTNYIMQAQEEERKRVSRDLHDGVGQNIYSMIVGLNMIEQMEHGKAMVDQFQVVKEMAVQALAEVRHIAVDLRPCALDDWGLLPALRSFVKQFEQTYGIVTQLHAIGQEGRRYEPIIETTLYRICQEAMINAAKYAGIDKIAITFEERDQQLYLTISDKGRGFDVENMQIQGTGLGLYGMKERAQLLHGTLTITSRIGQGTVVFVCVPLALAIEGETTNDDSSSHC